MKQFISIWSIFLLGMAGMQAQDQEEIQVVTKRITRTFPYSAGIEVNLEGQNADVFVESWDEDYISVEIELIAKHPEQATALADLERMNYTAAKVKRKIYLRNYVAEENKGGNSILKAKYIINVPEECPVYLKNQFGSTNVKDLANRLKIYSEFSEIQLNNINATVDMRTRFGDIYGYRLAGNYTINARRANLDLREVIGNYDITANYSMINLFAGQGLIDLNIDAQKTDVNLFNIDPLTHQHQILVQHGNLRLPDIWQYRFEQNTPETKRVVFKPSSEYFANITISVSFGDLKIEGKQ